MNTIFINICVPQSIFRYCFCYSTALRILSVRIILSATTLECRDSILKNLTALGKLILRSSLIGGKKLCSDPSLVPRIPTHSSVRTHFITLTWNFCTAHYIGVYLTPHVSPTVYRIHFKQWLPLQIFHFFVYLGIYLRTYLCLYI